MKIENNRKVLGIVVALIGLGFCLHVSIILGFFTLFLAMVILLWDGKGKTELDSGCM